MTLYYITNGQLTCISNNHVANGAGMHVSALVTLWPMIESITSISGFNPLTEFYAASEFFRIKMLRRLMPMSFRLLHSNDKHNHDYATPKLSWLP